MLWILVGESDLLISEQLLYASKEHFTAKTYFVFFSSSVELQSVEPYEHSNPVKYLGRTVM